MRMAVRAIAMTALTLIAACESPQVQPPIPVPPVVVGFSDTRGRQLLDTLFLYTGILPDSVIVRDGVLRLVLPPLAFGHGVQMDSIGCAERPLAMGAIHTLASTAWAHRDASVTRDTVEIVLAKATVRVENRTLGGSAWRECSAGPATLEIDAAALPLHNEHTPLPNVR